MATLTCPAGPMSIPRQSPMECTPALLATPIHRPHLSSIQDPP
uniref:Alternative protein WBP2 n=1 Tax=Homo sapiens TaxID=9606 RepID=L0R5E7_HUMAN|nr:alternative protein WBP2 [Homo sapiens]